jgi:hypothetical protein
VKSGEVGLDPGVIEVVVELDPGVIDVVGLEPGVGGDGPVRDEGPVPGVGGDGCVRKVEFDPGSI